LNGSNSSCVAAVIASLVLEASDEDKEGNCFLKRNLDLPSRSDLEEVERNLWVEKAAAKGRRSRHCITMLIVKIGGLHFIFRRQCRLI
jgi:hypothetical protein